MRPAQLAGAASSEPARRLRLRIAGERLEQLRLDLRPDPGHRAQPPAAAASRSSSGVCTPSAREISIERRAVSPR